MLSEQTIATVKATVPVLEEHGETLTRHFYERMFRENPEVKLFFNPAHQVSGSQQRALAGAICAYAANIDKLEILGDAVELIAQKHASLQIRAEHYPIVGANLLAAIREVLGEAATEDIIEAWSEAYGALADILIARETQIYQQQAAAPGGWAGFKPFRVARKVPESDIITSFYLEPVDGGMAPAFQPGQYITLRGQGPDGARTMRNYSLSDKPGQPHLRISVKRESGANAKTPDGVISNWLHDAITEGDSVELAPPAGEFMLDVTEQHDRPLAFLAGGIGITPIMSMMQAALDAMPGRQIILVHACLHEKVQAFRETLDSLAHAHDNLVVHHQFSEPAPEDVTRQPEDGTGLVDASVIENLLPGRDADYYFCGPKPFMTGIYHQLLDWGIPANQVRFEFFGPKQELARA